MRDPVIVMVAPNGARKMREDHAHIPLSIKETVEEAHRCFEAGASVLHAHVRGEGNEHILDVDLYRTLLVQMNQQTPNMLVQITSEAVGKYTPIEQTQCIQSVNPPMVSISLREITADFTDSQLAKDLFRWCEEQSVHVQHILYSADELANYLEYKKNGIIPDSQNCPLFVLGRYAENMQSNPTDLDPFLTQNLIGLNWFVCAFGYDEQACLIYAIQAGGHVRVGFENNHYLPNGEVASGTDELVISLINAMKMNGYESSNADTARKVLGIKVNKSL